MTSGQAGRIEVEGDDRFLVPRPRPAQRRAQRQRRKTLSSFENYRVLVGDRVLARVDEPAASHAPRRAAAHAHAAQPRRTHLALGPAAGRGQHGAAGHPAVGRQPAPPSNWNLLFALLAFVVYYNPSTSPGLGGSGRMEMGACTAGQRCHGGALALALALLWWREQGNRGLPATVAPRRRGGGMKTVRRLLSPRHRLSSVAFVAPRLLALFFFIDFVDELADRRQGLHGAARAGALSRCWPGHLYELLPIAVLIGTIYAAARLAQSPSSPSCAPAAWGPGRRCAALLAWAACSRW